MTAAQRFLLVSFALHWSAFGPLHASAQENAVSAEQREFFESRIRPVLVERCYECHNSAEDAQGGLSVDHRAAFLKGGDSGPVIKPGQPAKSRLLAILRHEVDGLEMPDGGPKLSDAVLADFTRWIEWGAPDPRDQPPSADELKNALSWEAMLAARKKWWSFQPIQRPSVPESDWSTHTVDRFIAARLASAGLKPAESADAATLVRRYFFTLTGLPPSPEEALQWTERLNREGQIDQTAVEELVDDLMERPQFGERWARHWMDWIRFAESHGSEGDPAIDNAYYYRDYLIRALNKDVPVNQLLREHVAGDLLDQPRINQELGINESAIGPAHWRMVFHGFAPTDALDEKVRFTDDQINAFSKAFLGLTVSCARCHDHKFDAISQKDYYALFGVLGSTRPGRVVIDTPVRQRKNSAKLAELKLDIRQALADDWTDTLPELQKQLIAENGLWTKAEAAQHTLHDLRQIRMAPEDQFAQRLQERVEAWKADVRRRREFSEHQQLHHWKLGDSQSFDEWFANGQGLESGPSRAGDFAVAPTGESAIKGVYPAGTYSHSLTAKHPARLTSPSFRLEQDSEVWIRVIGEEGATSRYVVQNYPRNGTVYPVTNLPSTWKWQRYDLKYWTGDEIHLELTAGKDAPLLVKQQDRSWFGIREAIVVKNGEPAPPSNDREFMDPVFEAIDQAKPTNTGELVDCYLTAVQTAIKAWQEGRATDGQATLLEQCRKDGMLKNELTALKRTRPLIDRYRQLENDIPVPTRVPGLDETVGRNQPLFTRGNHKTPSETVPRRFLEAIDDTPYKSSRSGRLELAEDLLRDDNPLTRRVLVNRIWHHVFGRGIVSTPDNFGRMGQEPTHPELLDWLAIEFAEKDWSIKQLVRSLVLTRTWQLTAEPSAAALENDPSNSLLSHANLRRLEAEAIRDGLLSVSGKLSSQLYGPSGDGRSDRRSIYVRVQRNRLDPFLRVFDFPEPFSATGRRDVTNVPAQSLTLMNDPMVAGFSEAWAKRVLEHSDLESEDDRIRFMFLTAFGRRAEDSELAAVTDYLSTANRRADVLTRKADAVREKIEAAESEIQSIMSPARERLLKQAEAGNVEEVSSVPSPIAAWDFSRGLQDLVGQMHGQLKGSAKLAGGGLEVDGRSGYILTSPLQKQLQEKTLEAWVQLANLDQKGGGVITLQTPDGVVFDSIVFGEKESRHWLAGSDNHRRTSLFGGTPETEANSQPVHIALTYGKDGRITGYRNGKAYGRSYSSKGPVVFKSGEAVVSFGLRHLPAGGNRLLAGRILKAHLYDQELTAEQIAASSKSLRTFVTEDQVLASLSKVDRSRVSKTRAAINRDREELAALGPIPKQMDERGKLAELARALFLFKEFIYLR